MQSYNSPEDYLRDVACRIRWRRAREPAVRELADHLDERCEALERGGASREEAVRTAVAELGDAAEVGAALDAVHRPRRSPALWCAALLLAAAGLALSSGFGLLTVPKLTGAALGGCAAVALFFSDYTALFRAPRLLYGLLLAASLPALPDVWLRGAAAAPPEALVPLLCCPAALAGILTELESGANGGTPLRFGWYAVPSLLMAALLRSAPAFLILLACDVFLLLDGRARLDWKSAVGLGGMAVCTGAAAFLLRGRVPASGPVDFAAVVRGAEWLGTRRPPDASVGASLFYDHPVTLLAGRFGKLPLLLLLLAFGWLAVLLVQAARRQTARLGRLLIGTAAVAEGARLLLALAADFGLLPGFGLGIPLAAEGGALLGYDLAVMGLALSAVRGERIAKDQIALRRRKEGRRWV